MNKQTFIRLLKGLKNDSLPLATLGVIEGAIEEYNDGKIDIHQLVEEIENVSAAFKDIQSKQTRSMMTEPCLSDE